MPEVEFRFLGAPQILYNQHPVMPDTRKGVALLAFLAVSNQPQTRDTLAALLYPDYDDAHARGALRRTLHAVRKILPEKVVTVSRDQIELSRGSSIWVDVNHFKELISRTESHPHHSLSECTVCLGDLEEATILYRGDFLAGFSLRDSVNFDDWQFFQSEELRRSLISGLGILTSHHRSHGNFDTSIQYAQRWVRIDPLSEEAHRELMLAFAVSGQRNAALRQYQECVRILEKELGVPPLAETTELYQEILENRVEINPSKAHLSIKRESVNTALKKPPRSSVHRFPLVGRSRESELLVNSYILHASNGYLLALEGETGIGKTRLAEEFLAFAQSQGAKVIKSRCFEGETDLAYSPLVDLLNNILTEKHFLNAITDLPKSTLSETARLAPALLQHFPDLAPPPPMEHPGSRIQFYESLRRVLIQISHGSKPGVLFLDDLQWADNATLDFLAYLARRNQGQSFFLLFAWRSEEFSGLNTLLELFANAERAGTGMRLKLSRLQPKDIADLLRSTGRQMDRLLEDLTDRLFQETEGLPYFVIEYLDLVLNPEAGSDLITNSESGWEIPRSVRDILLNRIRNLDPLSQQFLTTAAVIGRSFDFETLQAVSGRSELETIAGLEILLTQNLVEECTSCDSSSTIFYDFTHDKLRRLTYEETNQTRRRLLHRRIAEALQAQQRNHRSPGAFESSIAAHLKAANLLTSAAEHFKLAGDYARNLYANQEAIQHYQTALELDHPDQTEIIEAIGDLKTLTGAYDNALEHYEITLQLTPDSEKSRILHKIGNVHLRQGEWERSIYTFKQGYEQLQKPLAPSIGALILVDWSLAVFQLGQVSKAEELAVQALSFAEKNEDPFSATKAHNLLGILARNQQDYLRAKNELELSLTIAENNNDEPAQAAALNNLALVFADTSMLEDAIRTTCQALEISRRLGDLHRVAALHSNLADLYHKTGNAEQSIEHLTESVRVFAQVGEQSSELKPDIWKLIEW